MISFCTSYLGRHDHLKVTIPHNLMVARGIDCEFVYVDFSEYSDVWEVSRAKNIAHDMASGEILVNVDADNFLSRDYIDGVLNLFNKDMDIIIHGEGEGVGGRIAISKFNYLRLGGYDERFRSWGFDDVDFIYRAMNLGLRRYTADNIRYIPHENTMINRDKNRPLMEYNRKNNVINWMTNG